MKPTSSNHGQPGTATIQQYYRLYYCTANVSRFRWDKPCRVLIDHRALPTGTFLPVCIVHRCLVEADDALDNSPNIVILPKTEPQNNSQP